MKEPYRYNNFSDEEKVVLYIHYFIRFLLVYFTFLGFGECPSMDLLYILYGERNLVIHTKILTEKNTTCIKKTVSLEIKSLVLKLSKN
jgi:hypothetical protein